MNTLLDRPTKLDQPNDLREQIKQLAVSSGEPLERVRGFVFRLGINNARIALGMRLSGTPKGTPGRFKNLSPRLRRYAAGLKKPA